MDSERDSYSVTNLTSFSLSTSVYQITLPNRTINIMTLLDCAFSFFTNFPCRLAVSEMKFSLPCEESLFAAAHPFSEPNFNANRQLTTYEAFRSLFRQCKTLNIYGRTDENGFKGNPLNLNPMDMFILIHRMYILILVLY